MTTVNTLPERPSLDYERKQAKALVKAIKANEADAIARVHAQLPNATRPVSLRIAQLVIAREYGFAGWTDLKSAILQRSGTGLEWAAHQAQTAINANDVEALQALIEQYPELPSWQDPDNGDGLLMATTSYANFPGLEHEDMWNRPHCAELLLKADAAVPASVVLRILQTGALGMVKLFDEHGALPANLRTTAVLGDRTDIAACFGATGGLKDSARPPAAAGWPPPTNDAEIVQDALLYACLFNRPEVAETLLAACMRLQPELQNRVDRWPLAQSIVAFAIEHGPDWARFDFIDSPTNDQSDLLWRALGQMRLLAALHAGEHEALSRLFKEEPILRDASSIDLQKHLLEVAAYSPDCHTVIEAILASDVAITKAKSAPASAAVSYAVEYGNADYVPLLSQIWPVPDDLPHAAGLGKLTDVKRWFGDDGQAKLGDPNHHNPFPDYVPRVTTQDVLDRSLAWAVQNAEFAVADFLLAHGADINTRWSTHEPASILHECAAAGRMAQVKYLVERGIDLGITDHRFQSTAEGWARYGGLAEIADFLADAAQRQKG